MRRIFSRNAKLALSLLPIAVGCALAKGGDPPAPVNDPIGDGGEGTGGGGTSTGGGGTSTGGAGTSGASGTTSGTSGSGPTGGSAGSTSGGSTSGGSSGAGMTGGSAGQGGTAGTTTGGSGGSMAGSAGKGGTAGTATGGSGGSMAGSAGKGGTMTGGTGGGAAGGPPSGMELLRENFENGTSAWTMTPSGVWSTSMDGTTVLGSMGATGSSTMRSAAAGDTAWTDVQIEARVKVTSFAGSSSGYYAGICARYQSTSSYACFALRSNGQIMFRVGSNNTAAVNPPGGAIQEGTWYNVRVVARGSNITAFLNGTEIAAGSRVTSGAPASGRIALASPGTNAVFDDIVVTTP